MASRRTCRKRKGNADEDTDCDGNDDIGDFCIKEWWHLREELNRYPDFIDMEDVRLQKRSSILRYLYQAQLFEEKFGSDALSDHQKQRRDMYERAAKLKVGNPEKERDEINVTAKKPRVNYDLIEGMLIVEVERFVDRVSGVRKQGKSKVRARTFKDVAAVV